MPRVRESSGCRRSSLLLDRQLDGVLDTAGKLLLALHLDECSRCREALPLRRAVRDRLQRFSRSHRAPASLESAIRESFDRVPPVPIPLSRPSSIDR